VKTRATPIPAEFTTAPPLLHLSPDMIDKARTETTVRALCAPGMALILEVQVLYGPIGRNR
jgi:hypothetical protein